MNKLILILKLNAHLTKGQFVTYIMIETFYFVFSEDVHCNRAHLRPSTYRLTHIFDILEPPDSPAAETLTRPPSLADSQLTFWSN